MHGEERPEERKRKIHHHQRINVLEIPNAVVGILSLGVVQKVFLLFLGFALSAQSRPRRAAKLGENVSVRLFDDVPPLAEHECDDGDEHQTCGDHEGDGVAIRPAQTLGFAKNRRDEGGK